MGYDIESNEVRIEECKQQGCRIIRSSSNLLLLDIDDDESYKYYLSVISFVKKHVEFTKLTEWKSKSGKGRHIVLQTTRDLEPIERMLLQAILGSDRKREMFNLARLWQKDNNPIVLFRPKGKGTLTSPKDAEDAKP